MELKINTTCQIEQRIEETLGSLTLDEKISFLGGQASRAAGSTPAVARLGIPAIEMADATMGVHQTGGKEPSTTYPATIALAAAWDVDLARRMGVALGRDTRARGFHVMLGPGVNLYRSALCGRNFEYLGEDPVLAGKLAASFIQGVQDQGVCATVKHYALNFQEYDRYGVSSDVDERTLREVYLPAFEAAIRAGCGAVMTAYNLVNGIHCSEHAGLVRDILKCEWGFDGLVMSDWGSTHSAVAAANAGLDLEMPYARWLNKEQLLPALRDGHVTEAVIDDKVRRLLRLIFRFGWADRPQRDDTIPLEDPATASVSLEVARRGCVLLKNDDSLLPLDPGMTGTIAVIGPCAAETPVSGGGSGYNPPWRRVSILDGMRAAFGADRIRHAAGLPAPSVADPNAVFVASRYLTPEGAPGLRAEYFNNLNWSGRPVVTRIEAWLDGQWGDSAPAEGVDPACFSVRWTGRIRAERGGAHAFFQQFQGLFRLRVGDEVVFDLLDGATRSPPRAVVHLEAGRDYPIEAFYQRLNARNEARIGWEPIPEDASLYRTPDGAPGLRADYFDNPDVAGTPVLTRFEPRLEQRWGSRPLAEGIAPEGGSVRWTGHIRPERDGLHVFTHQSIGALRLKLDGEPVFDTFGGAGAGPARALRRLEAGRDYRIEAEFRRTGYQAEVCVSWKPIELPAEIRQAADLARGCDVVVFCGGHSEKTEEEGRDRSFALPEWQEELLLAVAGANPHVAAVITAGGNVDMRRWIDKVKALLFAWYPGQEGGTAVAEIFSGAVNPAGKLPATFERALEDRSSHDCYHDLDGDRRVALADGVFGGYRHHDRTGVAPLFPFGFGLSYTTFAYSNLQAPETMTAGETIAVSFDVENTGTRAGIEIAQLYARDEDASAPRPYKELKAFAAVTLQPGEKKTVRIELDDTALRFFHPETCAWIVEPGWFELLIGASAADIRLRQPLNVIA